METHCKGKSASTAIRANAYERDGVVLQPSQDGWELSYTSHGSVIRRRLGRGGPEVGTGEAVEDECGLHLFYDRPSSSWVLMHHLPHHRGETDGQEWFEDTIFIPDNGKIAITPGFEPAKPKVLWEHSIELIALIVGSAIGLWLAILFRAGCAEGSGPSFTVATGVSLVSVSLIAITLFYGSRRRASRAPIRRPRRE